MRTRRSVVVTVKITELKNRLSHYLRRVQRGDSARDSARPSAEL